MNTHMRRDLRDRYLVNLGVSEEAPSVGGLRKLVQAHICRVPFENISKLYYKERWGLREMPDLERYLDGMEESSFGGTCYPNNYHLYQLLLSLGYRARLCGADMSNPDVHLVSMVEIEGHEYLVDVGYAAPFTIPLPRDSKEDYVVDLGRNRYVLKPQDQAGRSRLEMRRDGQVKHGYLAKPEARDIREFEPVITHSYRDEATFMNAILLARFCPDRAVVIHNLTVTEYREGKTDARTVKDTACLAEVIEEHFGIPPDITREAVSKLGTLGDAWS